MNAQATSKRRRRKGGKRGGGFKPLIRAMGYLKRYKRMALIAYGSLLIATLAQLAIPQLIQNILDVVINGFTAHKVLELPEVARQIAAVQMGTTVEQFQANADGAVSALTAALVAILVFAVARGLFSFARGYMAEKLSQHLAFDFRNELYEKIQHLSFSYHDRNQTGQLMIRATDDVEKVRMFIGQGLVLALQSLVLLVGTLLILLLTNVQLTLVVLPTLPIALVLFMIFGAVAQPLFTKVQQKLSVMNTILQENMAGLKLVKAFVQEPREEARFDDAAEAHLRQILTVSKVFSFLFPFVFLIANLGQAAVMYFGGQQIINGTLTLG